MVPDPIAVIRLQAPVRLRDADSDAVVREITEIRVLREPVAGDLMRAEAAGYSSSGGAEISLALHVAGHGVTDQPMAVLRRLSIPDALAVAGVVTGFFYADGPATGPTSSESSPSSTDGAPAMSAA